MNIITEAIQTALNAAMSKRPNNALRYKLTEERVSTLRKIHGTDAAFLDLAHKLAGATNYRSINKYAAQIRQYVPDELAAKWSERDARKAEPILLINECVKVHFNARPRKTAFNPIRVVV